MASTYSSLKIELIGTGEQSGVWGNTTNVNLGTAIEEAITGSANVAFSSADVTVTLTDNNAAQTARNLRLNLTGTSGGARNLILGSGCQIEKLYLINNGLADAVTVKNTSGTGIAVPAGKTMFVYNNGTNVVEAVNSAVTLDATTVDATNIEVTNIKAKDGTAAGSIADSTGVVTLASSVLTTTDINGGTIDSAAIGGSTAAAGSFTTLNTSGQVVFNDAGANVDFRVEGDTNANLLFVDASADAVGIGTSSPNALLHLSANPPVFALGSTGTSDPRIDFYDQATTTIGGSIFLDQSEDNLCILRTASGTATDGMRITSAGEVLVGGTTENLTILNIATEAGLSVQSSASANLKLFRNDTSISSGNVIGGISWYGNDTTSTTPTGLAYIVAAASGTHAAGDNPTDLVFGTTPDGSATVAEVARFTESKYLRMASGSGGIQFNGDTAAANALDDYEEGTFTPVVADAAPTGGNTGTGTFQGFYTKIGNLVTCHISLGNISTTGMTSGNDLYVRNLPFTLASNNSLGTVVADRITFSGYLACIAFGSTTYLDIRENVSNATDVSILVSDVNVSGASDIFIQISYMAA